MQRLVRTVEIALGVFFIASAASKVVNLDGFAVQISLYGVLENHSLIRAAAFATVALETLLGAAFIAGRRMKGLSYAVAGGLTITFSALIMYAWRYEGLKDCGCFGEYVKMTPLQSILKNVVLLAVVIFGGHHTWRSRGDTEGDKPKSSVPVAAAILSLALVAGLGLFKLNGENSGSSIIAQSVNVTDEDGPFQRFQFVYGEREYNLGTGEYLVVLLNATCEHCIASVQELNELSTSTELPELVALMIADTGQEEVQLQQFRDLTSPVFPTQLIEVLDFVEFLEGAPPRLIYIREGREISGWEWVDDAPTVEQIIKSLST